MQTILLPTAYFPPISYMACLAITKHAEIEIYETFPKQTIRNRTIILTANGTMTLTVPVVKPSGNHTLTKEIQISYAESWQRQQIRAISAAYNASPYFMYYRQDIEKILCTRHVNLIDFNNEILKHLCKILHIEAEIAFTTSFASPVEGMPSDKNQRIDYRYKSDYKKNAFLEFEFPEYHQVFNDRYPFQPNKSVLDLLFNIGPEAPDYLRKVGVKIMEHAI